MIRAALKARFPDVEGRAGTRELTRLVSGSAAFDLQRAVLADPALIGTTRSEWLLASDAVDLLQKGHIERSLPEAERPLTDQQLGWIDKLQRRRRAGAQVQHRPSCRAAIRASRRAPASGARWSVRSSRWR